MASTTQEKPLTREDIERLNAQPDRSERLHFHPDEPIQLTYFKPSGKYYAAGELPVDLAWYLPGQHPNLATWLIAEHIEALQAADQPVPGLSTSGKSFIIHVTHPDGVPFLITNKIAWN